MLMGRTTYEAWADFWPQQDPEENPDATLINGVRKYVVSTTLEEPLEWQNSTLIAGSASGHPSGETCPVVATFEREVRPRSDPRKEGEAMARSEIMQKIEDLSEERERLLAWEGSRHTGVGDHRRFADIDHALGVLWDLRRRELAGEYVGLEEDFLDRYVVSPGDDAPTITRGQGSVSGREEERGRDT